MEIAKLLGYSESSEHIPANTREWQDHDEGGTEYKFYIELNSLIYYFVFNYSYGSCGSGYCGASWGTSQPELKLHNGELPVLTKPNKETFVYVVDNKVRMSILDQEEYYDPTVTCVNSTEGIMIVQETGDGGCQYYSSGQVNVNSLLF